MRANLTKNVVKVMKKVATIVVTLPGSDEWTTVNITNVTNNRVSYNGGPRGTAVAPTSTELVATREPHVAPTPMQIQHVQLAKQNPALLSTVNQGHPSIAATPRPAAVSANVPPPSSPSAQSSERESWRRRRTKYQ